LQEENEGASINGHWKGEGSVIESLNPATGQVIARVRTVGKITSKIFRDNVPLRALLGNTLNV